MKHLSFISRVCQKRFNLTLAILILAWFSTAKVTAAVNQDLCGEKLYAERIKLTEQRIIARPPTLLVLSPVKSELIDGCVGISFSINQQGEAFDMEIKKASHQRTYSRAAKKTLKKYRFKENSEVFKQGYLVIEFAE